MSSEPTRRRLSPDMIAALSAVLIGVCALGVSLYQASIMREQSRMMREEQRASVWPHVALEYSYTGSDFRLRLVNTGVGPAKIGPVRVTLDDEPVRTWEELLRAALPEQSVSYVYSQIDDRVLPAGAFETVFDVSDAEAADAVERHIDRVAIEVCYCSVYDECWRHVQRFGDEALREPIEQCRSTETEFLQ